MNRVTFILRSSLRRRRKSIVLGEAVTPFYFTKLTSVYYLRNFSHFIQLTVIAKEIKHTDIMFSHEFAHLYIHRSVTLFKFQYNKLYTLIY